MGGTPAFNPSQSYDVPAFDPAGAYSADSGAAQQAQQSAPADPGTLQNVWNWANRGLVSGKTLLNLVGDMMPRPADMKPSETTHDYLTRVQNRIDPDHPYLNALRVGLAGVNKDAYDTVSSMFTSPLGLTTLAAGGVGKLPGAAGKAARAISTIAATGFGAKGASDIYQAGTENTPEAWQQRLAGAAQVAGGAAAVGEVAPRPRSSTVRAAARTANKVLAKAPGSIGATIGGGLGAATHLPYGTEIGAAIGTMAGKELLPSIKVPGERFGLPDRVEGGPASAPAYEPAPVYPGAPLPEHPGVFPGAPLPENPGPARALAEGGKPYVDPAEGLGKIPVRAPAFDPGAHFDPIEGATSEQTATASQQDIEAPAVEATPAPENTAAASPRSAAAPASVEEPAPPPVDTSAGSLERQLREALGYQEPAPPPPLKPGVPLKRQASAPAEAPTVPDGFTPVANSSVLRGYKYNPAAQELEAITKNGSHYVHGEVTPEMYSEFEATDSKGKAWNVLRNDRNAVYVAKVHDGVRQAVKGFAPIEADQPATGSGRIIPKQQAGNRTVVIDPETGRPEFSDVLADRQAAAAKSAKPKRAIVRDAATGRPEFSDVAAKQQAAAQTETAPTMPADHELAGAWRDYYNLPSDSATNSFKLGGMEIRKVSEIPQPSGMNLEPGRSIHAQIIPEQNAILVKKGLKPGELQTALKHEFEHATGARPNVDWTEEYPDLAPKKPAGGEDLTAQLSQSVDVAKNLGKGGVMTSAAPADLMARWGVDRDAIAATDENLRGKSPADSQAYLKGLAEAYKNGQAIEPVLETRDADNNIVDVDGRHRALAASMAGIERIPIVIRRLGVTAGNVEDLAARPAGEPQTGPEAPQAVQPRKGRTNAAADRMETKTNEAIAQPSQTAGVAGAEVPKPIKPSAPTVPGEATAIRVPGEDRTYRAKYEVRELSDVQPSHSGITFRANDKYALVNDRDYANPLNQGKVVTNSAPGKFDPSYHITDNPDATNGPVVIDSDGHALGGNGRTMILQRVYKYNPEGAAAYKALLAKKAAQFGVDPAQLENMREPVLVRQLDESELASGGRQDAITDFNKSGTAAMTPAERAIADSRRISQPTLDDIAGRLESEGSDATLADVLGGRSGTQILDKLITDGVLPHQERAALATGDALTELGKDRIRKLLVARFFRDPNMIDTTPAATRAKVEAMTPSLARVDGVVGWDLTPHIQDAMQLLEESRVHGTKNIDDLLGQRGFWGEARYSPEAVTLAKAIQGSSARTLQGAIRRYVADMTDAHRPLLQSSGTISADEAFRDAFENPQPAKGRNAAAERLNEAPGLF